jgi:hypothetical protein
VPVERQIRDKVSSDGKTCCWLVMFIPTEQEMELIGSNAMSNTRYMNWHGNLEKHEHRNLNRVQQHQDTIMRSNGK